MRRHQFEGNCPTHASHSRASCKLSKLLRNSSFHPILTAKERGLVVLSLTRLTFVHRVVQFFTFEKNVTVAASSVLKKMLRFRAFGCSSMAISSSTALRYVPSSASVISLHLSPCLTCTETVPSSISSPPNTKPLRRSSSSSVLTFGLTMYALACARHQ